MGGGGLRELKGGGQTFECTEMEGARKFVLPIIFTEITIHVFVSCMCHLKRYWPSLTQLTASEGVVIIYGGGGGGCVN